MDIKKAVTLMSLAFGLLTAPAMGKDFAVAISPKYSENIAKKIATQVTEFSLSLAAGDSVWLINAQDMQTITHINIPKERRYRSKKARFNLNKKGFMAFSAFVKTSKKPSGQGTDSQVEGAILMPDLLRHVGANKGKDGVELLVFGSSIYDAAKDKDYSMTNARFPGDGHLNVKRNKSPFGIDQAGLLSGVRVHQHYGDERQFTTTQHKYYLDRFWKLMVEKQGGQLVSFTNDMTTLFQRVKNNVAPAPHGHELQTSDKLEIIRLTREAQKKSIYDRTMSTVKVSAQQVRQAQGVTIGISWQCECDLDLYAQAHPNSDVLYYGKTKSDLGVFYKDFVKSPETENGFETIKYSSAVDLKALRVAVNFFKGEAKGGVRGKIYISVDGQTYNKPFVIAAMQGGQSTMPFGQGWKPTTHMIEINPLDVIAL